MNAPTIVICLAILLIVLFGGKSYLKKLKSGCCGGGDAPQKRRRVDANLAHYAYHRSVAIDGMTCEHCSRRIENAFNELDDVYARVHLAKKSADVYSQAPLEGSTIRRIVAQAGYIAGEIEDKSRR